MQGGMSTAAVGFKGEVEKLKSKPFGTPAHAKALEDARAALGRFNQVRSSAREAIDTACRVPAILEHLKANGVIDAFKNVNAGIRASEDELGEHEAREKARTEFLRPEANIRKHVDGGSHVFSLPTERFKIEGSNWIKELAKLRRKVEDLETKTGLVMPDSTRSKLAEGDRWKQEIEKRLDKIRWWERIVIALVTAVILSIFIGFIALVIFSGPGSEP